MIERTITPGAKIDEMPVLISPQGGGKSAYVQHLLPRWAWRDWHGDALNLHATNKEQLVPVPIIIGTTNADISPDPTGTRRFMVLPVPGNGKTGEHNLEWMNHHRPVLWGTARHQYDTLAAGTGLNTRGWNINGQPPAEFIDDIRRITSEHTGTSTAEEAAAWLTERYRGQDPLSMTDLIGTWTDGNRRPRPRNDIGQHLLNLGWEKTRGPNRERLWIPPA